MSDTTTPQAATAAGAPPSAEADLSAQIDALFADFPGGGSPTPAREAATPAPASVAAAPVVPVAPAPPSASEHSVPASSSMFPAPKVEAPKPAPAPVVAAAAPAPAAAIEVEEVAPRGDTLLRAVGIASIPLMKRPPIVRKAVGWIALNSIVLGGALWALALFLRPVPEQANAKAFDFGHGSVPAVPVKQEVVEHSEAATKNDGKGTTAKKSEPKKADAKKAESNGGGH